MCCKLEVASWEIGVGGGWCDLGSSLMWSWKLDLGVGVGVTKFKLWRLFQKFEVRLQFLRMWQICECDKFLIVFDFG